MQIQIGQMSYRKAFKLPLFGHVQILPLRVAGVVIFSGYLLAVWQAPTYAQLSFGFVNDGTVASGMIVSISKDDTDSIERAHVNNASYVFGVAINQASSSVVFDQNSNAYVATEGTVDVFVSTIGGDIANGDLIVLSNIGGVGQRKDPDDPSQFVVGVAKSDFNQDSADAEQVELQAGDTHIGVIKMELLLNTQTDNTSSEDINVLVRIGQRIAGKPVSLTQVIISASVLIFGFVVSGSALFGSIKGSFTSIGRNPLSSKNIYKGMVRVSFISFGLIVASLISGYVILAV